MKIVRFCLLLTMLFSIAPAEAQDTKSIPWYGRLAVGFGHDDVSCNRGTVLLLHSHSI